MPSHDVVRQVGTNRITGSAHRLLDAHAVDRNPRCDLFEICERRMANDRDVGPSSRCTLEIAAQDRRPSCRIDLLEAHVLATTMAQHSAAACRAQVAYPVRSLVQHRYQI